VKTRVRASGPKLVNSPEAAWLAGLSVDRLRDWQRRALVVPQIPPPRQGCHPKYSWKSILLLRMAVILRDRFKLELGALGYQFFELFSILSDTEFASLWGKYLVLDSGEHWILADPRENIVPAAEGLLIRLDPHLQILSEAFFPPSGRRPPAVSRDVHSDTPAA
jgi:hypothetical protein